MSKILTFTLLMVILISCNKSEKNYTIQKIGDVEVVRNKNIPAFTKTEIKLNNLVEINGPELSDSLAAFYEPRFVRLDKNNDIYIADDKSCSVKRFTINGKFSNKLGARGFGPGEFDFINTMYFSRDTLCVVTAPDGIQKYSKEGLFYYSSISETGRVIGIDRLYQISDTTWLGYYLNFLRKNEEIVFKMKTSLLGDNLKEISNIKTDSIPMSEYAKNPHVLSELEHTIATDKKKVYLNMRTKEKYEILVYDFQGNHIGEIIKSFSKIPYSEEVKKRMEDRFKGNDYYKEMFDFRLSIERMMVDKYDNLWVKSGDLYDVFDNKGIYNGLVDFKTFNLSDDPEYFNNNTISFENDKIIITDYENSIVRVYDYEVLFSN
ncbi:MAG: hypothetical protein JXR48_05580 [Candidatus Delongbacteria bacterium]|nr:hypothetical protein [Candidatus Delongbacteria bacterium]MBN2834420.1 hypothetical protein [Candidatus Delongbacteria bacterium]